MLALEVAGLGEAAQGSEDRAEHPLGHGYVVDPRRVAQGHPVGYERQQPVDPRAHRLHHAQLRQAPEQLAQPLDLGRGHEQFHIVEPETGAADHAELHAARQRLELAALGVVGHEDSHRRQSIAHPGIESAPWTRSSAP